jgi:hypothetical protein
VLGTVGGSGGNLDVWGRHVSVTGTLDVMLDVAASGADDDQYLVFWQHAQAHDFRKGDVLGRRVTGSGTVVATETVSVAVDIAFEGWPPSAPSTASWPSSLTRPCPTSFGPSAMPSARADANVAELSRMQAPFTRTSLHYTFHRLRPLRSVGVTHFGDAARTL